MEETRPPIHIPNVPFLVFSYLLFDLPLAATQLLLRGYLKIPAVFAICVLTGIALYLLHRAYWGAIGLQTGIPAESVEAGMLIKSAEQISNSKRPALAQLVGPGLPSFPWRSLMGGIGFGAFMFLLSLVAVYGG